MTDWAKLQHAYGPASDVPALLEQLSPDPESDIWEELWMRICHQGTVYSASFPALPFLADAASKWSPDARIMPLVLAGSILISNDVLGDRTCFMQGLEGTVERLRQIASETLPAVGLSQTEFIHLLQATLALLGDTVWGRRLDRLVDGDFEAVCPDCDSDILLVIGKFGFFITAEEWVNRPKVKRNNIAPAQSTDLSGTGFWLYQRAVDHQQEELANWIRHLFGTAHCPRCGNKLVVNEAISLMEFQITSTGTERHKQANIDSE